MLNIKDVLIEGNKLSIVFDDQSSSLDFFELSLKNGKYYITIDNVYHKNMVGEVGFFSA